MSIEMDYPDGTELTVNVEPRNDPFAHLTPEEDQALRASIERGREQARQGLGRTLDEFLNGNRHR